VARLFNAALFALQKNNLNQASGIRRDIADVVGFDRLDRDRCAPLGCSPPSCTSAR